MFVLYKNNPKSKIAHFFLKKRKLFTDSKSIILALNIKFLSLVLTFLTARKRHSTSVCTTKGKKLPYNLNENVRAQGQKYKPQFFEDKVCFSFHNSLVCYCDRCPLRTFSTAEFIISIYATNSADISSLDFCMKNLFSLETLVEGH